MNRRMGVNKMNSNITVTLKMMIHAIISIPFTLKVGPGAGKAYDPDQMPS